MSVKESIFGDDFNHRAIPDKRDEAIEMLYEMIIRFIDHLSSYRVNDA